MKLGIISKHIVESPRPRRILVRVELIFKAPQQYVEIAFPLDARQCSNQIGRPEETVRQLHPSFVFRPIFCSATLNSEFNNGDTAGSVTASYFSESGRNTN